jgi:haloacid dehalogenase-like hydrolase
MATAASAHSGLDGPLAHRARSGEKTPRPICVDLDGTLLRTDLLFETFVAAVRSNFLVVLLAPLWLLRYGKAGLKAKLASLVSLDVTQLPYHEPLIAFLREKKLEGHRLYLTSAANRTLAQAAADHVGIFDGVLASETARDSRLARRSAVCLRGQQP